jgi:hypothetical protein
MARAWWEAFFDGAEPTCSPSISRRALLATPSEHAAI